MTEVYEILRPRERDSRIAEIVREMYECIKKNLRGYQVELIGLSLNDM